MPGRVTGSPVFHNGRLYVPVASGEENAGAMADYECCRFRGSVVALVNGMAGAEKVLEAWTREGFNGFAARHGLSF